MFVGSVADEGDKQHMIVGSVADDDVDVGLGSGDVDVTSESGSICVRSDESHIEGSENKGQYVGCFEHDVEICGDRERAKSNVVGSDPSSSSSSLSTLRRQQPRQQTLQPKHKRDKHSALAPTLTIATGPPAPAVFSPDDPTTPT